MSARHGLYFQVPGEQLLKGDVSLRTTTVVFFGAPEEPITPITILQG